MRDVKPGPRDWVPVPGPQTQFLSSTAYEVLYGGAAGGMKTESLLVAPLRWVHEPSFRALLLRRTYPELERSLIDRTRQLYPLAVKGAKFRDDKKLWSFPSGAKVYFGHVATDADVLSYQSAEFSFIGFDEASSFTEYIFRYLLSRARSAKGLPIRIRLATNPGGVGHEWLFRRWAPWLDPKCPVHAEPGEVLWYRHTDDGGEQWCGPGAEGALSRTFIPSRVTDNPHLSKNDPGYVDRLRALDPLTREQLLHGNWLAKPAKGLLFKRAWLKLIDIPTVTAARVRFWDRAATEDGGDWTVGVRLARTCEGLFIVEDVVRLRGSPHEVESTILATAALDGRGTMIGLEQEPGASGKFEVNYYVGKLAGFNVRVFRANTNKVARAQPVSAQSEAGNVRVVRANWNELFYQELEAFPEGANDDQVDGLSGAFAALTTGIAPALDPRFRAFAPRARM